MITETTKEMNLRIVKNCITAKFTKFNVTLVEMELSLCTPEIQKSYVKKKYIASRH